jgi:hypothetical protein
VQPLLQKKSNEYYTTFVCVFVALGIQDGKRMRHTVIISQTARFSKKKKVTEHKMCVLIFSRGARWRSG